MVLKQSTSSWSKAGNTTLIIEIGINARRKKEEEEKKKRRKEEKETG